MQQTTGCHLEMVTAEILSDDAARMHTRALHTHTQHICSQALGGHQADVMSGCLEQRYPRGERIVKAVWRGSNTDHHLGNWLTTEDWEHNLRVQV